MDKSFNDDELSDIMKEIEALEDDFSTKEEVSETPAMEDLAEVEEIKSMPDSSANVVSFESQRSSPRNSSGTSMSFKVQGDLTLDLQFDIGGKTVCLEVTQDGLTIEMEGGMKFTVPVDEKSAFKKAV